MYEFKVEDGETLVRRTDRRGRWGKPVVDSKGGFFDSLSAAASSAKVHSATMVRSIDEGREIDGVLYAYATTNEVSRHCRLSNYVETQKDRGVLAEKKPEPKDDSPKVPVKPSSMPAPADPVWTAKSSPESVAFYGVVWPDGTATIRLAEGDFMFSRKRVDDFPAEMRNATRWVVARWE